MLGIYKEMVRLFGCLTRRRRDCTLATFASRRRYCSFERMCACEADIEMDDNRVVLRNVGLVVHLRATRDGICV